MSSLRVLIVDDEFLVSDYVADVVSEGGHLVVGTAETADAALALLGTHRPDVAVLDIKLRGEPDGVSLSDEIRRRAPLVQRIFISGSGDPETLARAQETQPLAFLQKPFQASRLLDILARLSPPADEAC